MEKRIFVLSIGGSQIFKDNKINTNFLNKFKKIILSNTRNKKFIIVCGGGSVARTYIQGLKEVNATEKLQSFAGISVTRTNARFMGYFFGFDSEDGIAHTMRDVENMVKKQDIVFCGALEYHPHQTSDSTAAQIAEHFSSDFINITNVAGLYTANPLTNKNAKFIPYISWKGFHEIALKIPFKPGQHFVLDQKASKIIMDKKIKTYILGSNIKNLDNLLKNRKFNGTIIFG
ncbi:UMP kinase [Candidatus Pacearchaeota archaeon]|nr:UMP kinase [Candidatus Pacearchaeota archaeon]